MFHSAAEGDPTIEDGGPDRALALTYLRAPGWPTGPGAPDLVGPVLLRLVLLFTVVLFLATGGI